MIVDIPDWLSFFFLFFLIDWARLYPVEWSSVRMVGEILLNIVFKRQCMRKPDRAWKQPVSLFPNLLICKQFSQREKTLTLFTDCDKQRLGGKDVKRQLSLTAWFSCTLPLMHSQKWIIEWMWNHPSNGFSGKPTLNWHQYNVGYQQGGTCLMQNIHIHSMIYFWEC